MRAAGGRQHTAIMPLKRLVPVVSVCRPAAFRKVPLGDGCRHLVFLRNFPKRELALFYS